MQALIDRLETIEAWPDTRRKRRVKAALLRRISRRVLRQARRRGELEQLKQLQQQLSNNSFTTPDAQAARETS